KERFDRLLKEVQQISTQKAKERTGTVHTVLAEEVNQQDSSLLTGRSSQNFLVHFPGDREQIGTLVDVRLEECKGFYYLGTQVGK
ncbi:MAG TPA: tRNA (N6-isopentenyl adenosine(37)-C2)-methylthiotransferase MiaB, partial [Lachnospiraceae bacterium]|nr:tRNA (N6-isopentenyl adenosine(37)-C2)-methylthiotransferase MiaB [Lachnospiraceae bacterium]